MNAQIKKPGSAKMSHSGKVAAAKVVASKAGADKVRKRAPKTMPRTTWGKTWRGVLWLLFVLLVISAIAIAYIWHFRMDLAENQLQKLMAKNGYDVTFELETLSKTQAIATDITVSKDADTFLTAERIIIDYDINKRMAQRIVLIKPDVRVAFDTKGKIVSNWLPKNSGGSQELLMPPNGLEVKDATINWQLLQDNGTTMGEGQTSITADIKSTTHWNAGLSSVQTHFSSKPLMGEINYDVFIETQDGLNFNVIGAVQAQDLTSGFLSESPMQANKLESDFKLNIMFPGKDGKIGLSGWVNNHITDLSLQNYKVESADVKLKQISYESGQNYISAEWISAQWQVDIKRAQISDNEIRAGLAGKLTSYTALSDTPIAKHFTQNLYEKTERLLSGLDINGQGNYQGTTAGYKVELEQPLRLNAPNQSVTFTARDGAQFLEYNNRDKTIAVKSNINWSGERALNLTNFNMKAKSLSGFKIDGMQRLSAHIRSTQEWRARAEQQNLRLAPFDFKFSYVDQGNNIRTIDMNGALDYDGPVPGGAVTGLVAGGAVSLNLIREDFTLGFTPSGPLSIATFNNPSGWKAKSLTFNLQAEDKLLSRAGRQRPMHMVLTDVRTQIVGPENARHLDTAFEQLDVVTDLTIAPQHWQVQANGTNITSEDFPAPGTQILTQSAMLDVYQTASGGMTFKLLSPNTHVATDNATITDLDISLEGSPDDIALKYNAGSVTMVGGAVPVLPMHGTARLKSGELTGHAITNLPRTKNTPIDIHYRSKDGQGSAKILIPKIIFDPRGLQPQHLVPVLRGKLAEVSGEVSAEFDFKFGDGLPMQSHGTTDLIDLNLGTLVGPLSGINSKLTFASIFPLKSEGVQTATLAGFDPGFPLKDGTIEFEIIPGGVTLHKAIWPIANIASEGSLSDIEAQSGSIFLTPMDWLFGDVENLVTVNIENVGLGTMLAGIGKDKFNATGQVSGTLPARVSGVNVLIDDGVLAVKDGGVIQYKSAVTDAAGTRNETAGHAFQALENFTYRQLEARIDGPIDGAMALKIIFDGHNPDVLGGQAFQFNTNIKGELANIARNMAGAFSNEENLSRIMEIRNGEAGEQP